MQVRAAAGLHPPRGVAACKPRRGAALGPDALRRHLALSTNLIVKITNLAGLDSCAPGGRAGAAASVAPS